MLHIQRSITVVRTYIHEWVAIDQTSAGLEHVDIVVPQSTPIPVESAFVGIVRLPVAILLDHVLNQVHFRATVLCVNDHVLALAPLLLLHHLHLHARARWLLLLLLFFVGRQTRYEWIVELFLV